MEAYADPRKSQNAKKPIAAVDSMGRLLLLPNKMQLRDGDVVEVKSNHGKPSKFFVRQSDGWVEEGTKFSKELYVSKNQVVTAASAEATNMGQFASHGLSPLPAAPQRQIDARTLASRPKLTQGELSPRQQDALNDVEYVKLALKRLDEVDVTSKHRATDKLIVAVEHRINSKRTEDIPNLTVRDIYNMATKTNDAFQRFIDRNVSTSEDIIQMNDNVLKILQKYSQKIKPFWGLRRNDVVNASDFG